MSNNARVIKYLKETLERIDRIESVCKNNGGVVAAIKDEDSAQLIIMMHLMIINQQFEKLKKQNRTDILKYIPDTIIHGLKKSRDITAHDYDSLNYAIIENTIRFNLPIIKTEFNKILQEILTQTPQEQLNAEIMDYIKHKDILYPESKIKKESTILNLYKELVDKGVQIDDKDLKIIKSIQQQNATKQKVAEYAKGNKHKESPSKDIKR